MIRRNQEFLNRVNILLDMLIVVGSFMLASWLRLDVLDGSKDNMAALSARSVLVALAYALVLFFLLSLLGFYNTTRTRKLTWKVRTIFIAVTLSALVASTVFFVFKLVDVSRGVMLVFYLAMLVFLNGKYAFMRLVLSRFRGKGYNIKHVAVIGTGSLAKQYKKDVEAEPELGFQIREFIGADDTDRMNEQLASPDISEVVIALEPDEYTRIREIISVCERNGAKYSVIPFYNDIIPANPEIEQIGKSKLISMRSNRLDNMGWKMMKRGFDLICSFMGLLVLSPLLLVIALGVKLSSPGPVLFRQKRVGYEKREFEMLKFRSMKVNDRENTGWTKDADNRRTPFGAFLRKTSLDELPQLINVLKGDMSLVGPRPELPFFVEQFRESIPFYMVKHQVKPGMTGWAQVHGYRGDTSIEKRIELDLWYIDNWSVGLDLRILAKTFFGGMVNKESMKWEKEA